MACLDDVKILLNIDTNDTSQDAKINLHVRKAKTLISNYLHVPLTDTVKTDIFDNTYTVKGVDVETTYPDAVVQYVIECMNKQGNEGLKQFTQGSRSGTYGNELSDTVKALLPLPYATLA